MFPQRSRVMQQQFSYYQERPQFPEHTQFPQQRKIFGGVSRSSRREIMPYSQVPGGLQHQQVPFQTQKKSILRDAQGNLDFKKIGGGVQTAIGLINQASPMIKMLGGFFK